MRSNAHIEWEIGVYFLVLLPHKTCLFCFSETYTLPLVWTRRCWRPLELAKQLTNCSLVTKYGCIILEEGIRNSSVTIYTTIPLNSYPDLDWVTQCAFLSHTDIIRKSHQSAHVTCRYRLSHAEVAICSEGKLRDGLIRKSCN